MRLSETINIKSNNKFNSGYIVLCIMLINIILNRFLINLFNIGFECLTKTNHNFYKLHSICILHSEIFFFNIAVQCKNVWFNSSYIWLLLWFNDMEYILSKRINPFLRCFTKCAVAVIIHHSRSKTINFYYTIITTKKSAHYWIYDFTSIKLIRNRSIYYFQFWIYYYLTKIVNSYNFMISVEIEILFAFMHQTFFDFIMTLSAVIQ